MEKLSRKDMEIRRLRGAKLLADGTSQADVARICGVSRATTSKWAIALEIGADLKMRKAPGRPPKLTLPKTIALCKMVSANPQWTLEQIRQAITYAADLEAWVSGEPARQWFRDVRLRVRGNRVETSTGQSASLDSVRKVLPVVLRRRNSFGPVQNLMVDSFPVVEQSTEGVKVGCTLVPWGEVER